MTATEVPFVHVTSEGGSICRDRFLFLRQDVDSHTRKNDRLDSNPSSPIHVIGEENDNSAFNPVSGVEDFDVENFGLPNSKGPLGGLLTACCGDTINAMNVLVAMDHWTDFSSQEVSQIVEQALLQCGVEKILKLPLTDGGEGFLDTFRTLWHQQGRYSLINVTVNNAVHQPIPAALLINRMTSTAIIETASLIGTGRVPSDTLLDTQSTYGVGEMISTAIQQGAKRIVLGVGTSSTLDGGSGLAQALGVVFRDSDGVVVPSKTINPMLKATVVDVSGVDPTVFNVDIVVAVHRDHPFTGTNGEVAQKLNLLDGGQIQHYEETALEYCRILCEACGSPSCATQPLLGDGGGLAIVLHALFGAKVVRGFEFVASELGLQKLANRADLIITGEECFDESSIYEKVPVTISRMAKGAPGKVFLYTSRCGFDHLELPSEGIDCIVPLMDSSMTELLAAADATARRERLTELLQRAVIRDVQVLRLGRSVKV